VKLTEIRKKIFFDANLKKIVSQDHQKDALEASTQPLAARSADEETIVERAHLTVNFPTLPSRERMAKMANIAQMIDLQKVVVVTGYGEFGPYGNARTRWDIEKNGKFSLEGIFILSLTFFLFSSFSSRD
jgi:3-oxoacyl-ACP reductase-like protein